MDEKNRSGLNESGTELPDEALEKVAGGVGGDPAEEWTSNGWNVDVKGYIGWPCPL